MALLSIQERSGGSESSNAVVSFDNGPLYPITISNPFSDEEEQELEWYFEEHLEFPFTNKVRAQNAARSITTYGENLFKQVFGDNDVYAEYRALLIGGLSGLQIEIEGSPTFHALHWEAIKDPRFEQPLALQAVMIRKNLHPQALPASARPSPTINLLIVTARPSVERDVGYRTISRPLVESLRNANLAVQVDILRPGTYKALENHLRVTTEQHGEGYYHVIHFDVHGAVLAYEQYESIQPRGVGNSHLYKQYGRNPIQPYEGVKAFLSFEPDANDEDTKKKTDLVEATQLAASARRTPCSRHYPQRLSIGQTGGRARDQLGQPPGAVWRATRARDGLFRHCQRRRTADAHPLSTALRRRRSYRCHPSRAHRTRQRRRAPRLLRPEDRAGGLAVARRLPEPARHLATARVHAG